MELEMKNQIAADEEGIRLRREADLLRKIKLLQNADLRHREIIDRRRAREREVWHRKLEQYRQQEIGRRFDADALKKERMRFDTIRVRTLRKIEERHGQDMRARDAEIAGKQDAQGTKARMKPEQIACFQVLNDRLSFEHGRKAGIAQQLRESAEDALALIDSDEARQLAEYRARADTLYSLMDESDVQHEFVLHQGAREAIERDWIRHEFDLAQRRISEREDEINRDLALINPSLEKNEKIRIGEKYRQVKLEEGEVPTFGQLDDVQARLDRLSDTEAKIGAHKERIAAAAEARQQEAAAEERQQQQQQQEVNQQQQQPEEEERRQQEIER